MGYDTCECIFCYTVNGGNEATDNTVDICFICLEKYLGKHISGRVMAIFNDPYFICPNAYCSVCKETRKFVCTVKCCDADKHLK